MYTHTKAPPNGKAWDRIGRGRGGKWGGLGGG